MDIEAILMAICAFCVLALPFLLYAFVRYLRYRETVALAEKGLLRPSANGNGHDSTLRWGIVITALGLALICGLYPLGWAVGGGEAFPMYFGPWMIVGLVPTAFGLALLLIHRVARREGPTVPDAGAPDVGGPGPSGSGSPIPSGPSHAAEEDLEPAPEAPAWEEDEGAGAPGD